MFTFSVGFEAATLKIPNKDLTSYGSGPSNSGNLQSPNTHRSGSFTYPQAGYSISSDQNHVVGLNQLGESSWPPGLSVSEESLFSASLGNAGGHIISSGVQSGSPRKQIIGFAKFRTRTDALTARDTLQGRRVDIEKGAVLKAEMAKKNLHTKRGVGPLNGGNRLLAAMVGGEPAIRRRRTDGRQPGRGRMVCARVIPRARKQNDARHQRTLGDEGRHARAL